MVKIESVEKVKSNLDILDYTLSGSAQKLSVYRKHNTRFDVDGDTEEVRFYQRVNSLKKFSFIKSFSFQDFAEVSTDWIKKHKKESLKDA